MNSRTGSAELSPISIARWPEGWIVTGTRLFESVSRITRLVVSPTPKMRPASPSPSVVAQPSRMPSRAPTLRSTDCRKGEPESASTTPVTKVSAGSSRTRARSRSLAFSCSSWSAASRQARIWRSSRRSSWFCS
jgi:hypothetical protein